MVVKHLIKVARKHKALIAMFLLMGLFWTFLQNFTPLYFQTVVDNFTDGSLTAGNIAVYGTSLIALYIMGYVINYPWVSLLLTVLIQSRHMITLYFSKVDG